MQKATGRLLYINELNNNVNLFESVYFGNLLSVAENVVGFGAAAIICIITKDPLPDFRTLQEQGGLDAILISHAHMDHIGVTR